MEFLILQVCVMTKQLVTCSKKTHCTSLFCPVACIGKTLLRFMYTHCSYCTYKQTLYLQKSGCEDAEQSVYVNVHITRNKYIALTYRARHCIRRFSLFSLMLTFCYFTSAFHSLYCLSPPPPPPSQNRFQTDKP